MPAYQKAVILGLIVTGSIVVAVSILWLQQRPTESTTISVTDTPESVQVDLDSPLAEDDTTGRSPSETTLNQGEGVTLPADSEHQLATEQAQPAWPGISQSDVSIELIPPRKAILTATFRDLTGRPIPNLPVEITCSTLDKSQIHPTQTETDPNGLVFSMIEGSPGTHTIYVMLNEQPFFWEKVEFQSEQKTQVAAAEPSDAQASPKRKDAAAQPIRFEPRRETLITPPPQPPTAKVAKQVVDSRGTLVVTSQPLNAAVYINGEKVPRGTTPVVLSLDQSQQYNLRIQKKGYKPIGDSVAVPSEQPVNKSYVLTPFTVMGFILYQHSESPVVGAEVSIEELEYTTISNSEGRFEFRDWETYPAPEVGQKYALRLSDSQRRFLPVTREFDIGNTPLGVIMVERIVTINAYVTDQSSGEPLSDAVVTINNNRAVRGKQDGLFVAEVTDSTQPVRIQVKREWYETSEGLPVYEETLHIPPNTHSHFVPVLLSPKLFTVELPGDWDVPNARNVEIVVKPSVRATTEIQGAVRGRSVFFRYSPFLLKTSHKS